MTVRLANRILAVSVALGLVVGGVVVAAEIVLAGFGRGPWVVPYDEWYASARRNHWDSAGVRWLFIGVCAAGLVVLALQIAKAAPRSVPLQPGQSDAGLSRRSLERALARTAGKVDGVSAAKAAVQRDRARITVDTNRKTGDLRPAVEEAVQHRLQRAGLAQPPNVVVTVNNRAR